MSTPKLDYSPEITANNQEAHAEMARATAAFTNKKTVFVGVTLIYDDEGEALPAVCWQNISRKQAAALLMHLVGNIVEGTIAEVTQEGEAHAKA